MAVKIAVITPLYPLYVIMLSIDTAVRTLRGEVTEEDKEFTKEYKLIEIIGEGQCCIEYIAMFLNEYLIDLYFQEKHCLKLF